MASRRRLLLLLLVLLAAATSSVAAQHAVEFALPKVRYVLDHVKSESVGDRMTDAQLNCAACERWLEALVFDLPASFSYAELRGHMTASCASPWVKRHQQSFLHVQTYRYGHKTARKDSRVVDLSARCAAQLNAFGDAAADLLWSNWEVWYPHGLAPAKACSALAGCGFTAPQDALSLAELREAR